MYSTRLYDVRVLLASPDAPALWDYSIWKRLVPSLTPLLSSERGRTSLRMTQTDTQQSGSPNQARVRFGPIGWNEKAHRKWTHRSPDTVDESDHWDFYSFSAWSPGPGKCAECPPDGFMAVVNEISADSGLKRGDCQFAYSVLVALACDVPNAESTMDTAFSTLSAEISSVLKARTRRAWSPTSPCVRTGQHIQSLTDMDAFGAPFVLGPTQKSAPSLSMLLGEWEAVS
ncbi:hypothetical protein [Ottowia thiooxydans]|uniref:hypothetical protein n=1 Tax=Ottowia thiooxydans TaxID=219182 RepID=UPI0012EB2832|nr:hypothetical protein [Ottowia thiooxydans]